MTELSVFSSIGVRSAAEELFRKFEQQNGSRLVVTWGTAPMLVARIEAGERADVLILSRAGIDTLHKQGKILSGTPIASHRRAAPAASISPNSLSAWALPSK